MRCEVSKRSVDVNAFDGPFILSVPAGILEIDVRLEWLGLR